MVVVVVVVVVIIMVTIQHTTIPPMKDVWYRVWMIVGLAVAISHLKVVQVQPKIGADNLPGFMCWAYVVSPVAASLFVN